MEKIRNDYFDNIKSVLITLVVIGHFLLPLESTRLKDGLVNVIYLFHMPMFIMVSGYFAKGMYAGKRFRWERIGKLLSAFPDHIRDDRKSGGRTAVDGKYQFPAGEWSTMVSACHDLVVSGGVLTGPFPGMGGAYGSDCDRNLKRVWKTYWKLPGVEQDTELRAVFLDRILSDRGSGEKL